MQSFLSIVTEHFISKNIDLSNYQFILPNKRSGIFLNTKLKESYPPNSFLPKIISIEEFISDLANVQSLDNISLLFEFYSIYLKYTPKEAEPFESFSNWAILLLQDFNEIDKNLIDTEEVFNYLTDSKRIEDLFSNDNKHSTFTTNYFNFIERIPIYYKHFYHKLKSKQIGYQGLLYKEAVENLNDFVKANTNVKSIFVGFNALNKAEEHIIQILLENDLAEIYWDTDCYYSNDNNPIGKYTNHYKNNWKHYQSNDFNWVFDNLNQPKKIFSIGTSKQVSQIKYLGEILSSLDDKKNNYKNTAIVMANEDLLPVLINSLPKDVTGVNITMGYNLKDIPLASVFESLFKLHLKNKNHDSFLLQDFINLMNLPSLNKLIDQETFRTIIKKYIDTNTVYISYSKINTILEQITSENIDIGFLFENWENNTNIVLQYFSDFIKILKEFESDDFLQIDYLFRFESVFQQLQHLNSKFAYIINLKSLFQFYNQILSFETLSFQGEPLKGLQIMGMLESRVLDFENVIITSVNEGILPAGKTQNSFIPFDIKLRFKIPTYIETDSIYAYHFYRLLHRAKNVYLLYNSETGDFGSGEQSRFITQLEIAKDTGKLSNIEYTKQTVNPIVTSKPTELKTIEKNNLSQEKITQFINNGISPSALTSYIRNPIDFYKNKVLKIKDLNTIEENVAANTFGTIIHESIENLYKPYENSILTIDILTNLKKLVNKEVLKQFNKFFSLESISSGKNKLSFEVAKKYIRNFINHEIGLVKSNKEIYLIELEKKLLIDYEINNLNLPIKLKGTIDRVDMIDGTLRIVDYKTGKVTQSDLNIRDWDKLSSEYKFSKSFQVLMYAYMYSKHQNIDLDKTEMKSGIISFKNLNQGFMSVNKGNIHLEEIENFKDQMDSLIIELLDINYPFVEKEIKQFNY